MHHLLRHCHILDNLTFAIPTWQQMVQDKSAVYETCLHVQDTSSSADTVSMSRGNTQGLTL